MTCNSCSCSYKIGIEMENRLTKSNPFATKHLCFKCGVDLIPMVLKTVKNKAVEKLVDNISTQLKSLLILPLIFLFGIVSCASSPIIYERHPEVRPSSACELIPNFVGECKYPSSTQQFYFDLEQAKKEYSYRK